MNEIFITPLLDNAEEVLGIIFHEIVHAVDDCKSGHGKAFKTIATKIGLTGKMIHAHRGEELSKQVKLMASELGDYPHKRLITKPSLRPQAPETFSAMPGMRVSCADAEKISVVRATDLPG